MLFVDGSGEDSGEGALTLGWGLLLDQTLGREGEVPVAACVPSSSPMDNGVVHDPNAHVEAKGKAGEVVYKHKSQL